MADKRESQALDAMSGPAVILSASGMCEGGRVVHHFVGYQAPHTLGRRLVDGDSRVRIFGVKHERRAETVSAGGAVSQGDGVVTAKAAACGVRNQGRR